MVDVPVKDRILSSVKKGVNIDPSYDAFDTDIIIHINSVFGTLQQLGVGPIEGFAIDDDSSLWKDYVSDITLLNFVKSYMILSVRLRFDPPSTSFAIESMRKQTEEMAWRINVHCETLRKIQVVQVITI